MIYPQILQGFRYELAGFFRKCMAIALKSQLVHICNLKKKLAHVNNSLKKININSILFQYIKFYEYQEMLKRHIETLIILPSGCFFISLFFHIVTIH